MNNFYKTTNFSPTAQQPNSPTAQKGKLKLKWLLSFCLICLLFLSSNSVLAQPIAFTFNGLDNNQSTITKTVSGVTLTLSNEQPDNNFQTDGDGLAVLANTAIGGALGDCSEFTMMFSADVQLLSYNIAYGISSMEGDESLTFTDGSSTTIESGFSSLGSHNFSNQICITANTSITVTSDFGGGVTNDLIQFISMTVQPETCSSSNPASIPTLSEWGLLILALLLMTLGTLYLLQQPRFEQER